MALDNIKVPQMMRRRAVQLNTLICLYRFNELFSPPPSLAIHFFLFENYKMRAQHCSIIYTYTHAQDINCVFGLMVVYIHIYTISPLKGRDCCFFSSLLRAILFTYNIYRAMSTFICGRLFYHTHEVSLLCSIVRWCCGRGAVCKKMCLRRKARRGGGGAAKRNEISKGRTRIAGEHFVRLTKDNIFARMLFVIYVQIELNNLLYLYRYASSIQLRVCSYIPI